MAVKRVPVESSMIASVGYDEAKRILEIEFNSGRIYRYANVPPEVYRGLMEAESHGRYFLAHIKGVYAYRRVR